MLLHKMKLKNYSAGKKIALETVSFVRSRPEGRDLHLTRMI